MYTLVTRHKPRREGGKSKKQMTPDQVRQMLKSPFYGKVVRRSAEGESKIEGDIRLHNGGSVRVVPRQLSGIPKSHVIPIDEVAQVTELPT